MDSNWKPVLIIDWALDFLTRLQHQIWDNGELGGSTNPGNLGGKGGRPELLIQSSIRPIPVPVPDPHFDFIDLIQGHTDDGIE